MLTSLKAIGYALSLPDCFMCEKPIEGRVFFDYRSGAFLCEECREEQAREISCLTYFALSKAIENTLTDQHEGVVKALKLIDYYLVNRAEERLSALDELIKILN